jgi:WD40 repeat protein/transcriptional regulator with XRE-family HTH domain
MKSGFSGEHSASFGQMILSVRGVLELTRAELARQLAVSSQTVRNWETGNRAPNPDHLKQFIELALRQQVFSIGQEEEEMRMVWKKAQQQVPLDEGWLKTLLAAWLRQQECQVPLPGVESRAEEPASLAAGPQVDWGEALAIPTLYGREQELEVLFKWIVQERCRVVSVLGMGGIGKSALVVKTMYHVAEQFEVVLFRSLRDGLPCEALLEDCLQVLSPQSGPLPVSLEQRMTLLLDHLARRRTLLVLDNLESLLDEREQAGRFRAGFEGYEYLMNRIAQGAHQSCLVVTSREQAGQVRLLESRYAFMRTLRLVGLDLRAGERLLCEKKVQGTEEERAHLIERYGGNPLALRMVSESIADHFAGQIDQFLAAGPGVFGSMIDLLDEHWVRLSWLEQSLLRWLAILREPVTLSELQSLQIGYQPQEVLNALDRLSRCSLIERGQRPGSFTLQSVVLAYVTAVLVSTVTEEIQQDQMDVLIEHGLELARSKEHLRQAQECLLLRPILERLQNTFQEQGEVEEQLLRLLEHLRAWEEEAQGYGPANLIALLRLLRGHLRGLDLSQLALREANLQGVEMQDSSLVGSTLRDTVFTKRFDHTDAIAISRTGQYWAAGSWRGDVQVWREEGRRLSLAWQAHNDNTFTLAFSPDEQTLATGSWDDTVKLWDLHSGVLLWTAWHSGPLFSIAFSPDGRTLASGGNDACIKLWDVGSGQLIQNLASPGGWVVSVAWSPDGHLLAGGCVDGNIWLWQVQENQPATSISTLVGHTLLVHGLSFSPDGTQLASGSWDGSVKLWDVTNGRELQMLPMQTQRVYDVAWSPNGHMLASVDFHGTIWLWDVVQQRYRIILHGHTAVVHDLAFTPDSSCLLSGGQDGTIRLWNVTSGQCIRTIEGYGVSLRDVAWSPDNCWLASAGSDRLATLWEVTGRTPPRELHGHRWCVRGVAWSPSGRLLASAGWDNAIRIWDPATGTCLQILQDPNYSDCPFHDVAWSPDGSLLVAGDSIHGLHSWDMTTFTLRWLSDHNPAWIHHVVWSPDGTRLACCEDDCITLWEGSDGRLLQRLQRPHTKMLSIAWSPDGGLLANGGYGRSGGEVLIWEMASEHRDEPLYVLSRLAAAVFAVEWSPDGKVLISGESTGKLQWWDVASRACLAVREGHDGAVQALKVDFNGHLLASCGDDGTIRLWELKRAELVRTLRRDRPYERMNITGIQGLTQAEIATLRALGAVEDVLVTG